MQVSQPSILISLLKKILQKYNDNIEQLNDVKFNYQLQLIIIQKNPFYISDSLYSIQGSIFYQSKKLNSSQNPKPNNKIRSSFYNTYPKSYITLNCKDQNIQQPYDYPHPYGPYFHFKEKYQQFLQERKNIKWQTKYDTILIKLWGMKIVNIANTGYYAPVLEIYEYQTARPKKITSSIPSILYEKFIQIKMEQLRLKDLRKLYKQDNSQKKNNNSMCYYLRSNAKFCKTTKTMSPFIAVDYDSKILKYNSQQNSQKYFVCTSDIEGICCFMNPISLKGITLENKHSLNYQAVDSLLPQQPQQPSIYARSNISSSSSQQNDNIYQKDMISQNQQASDSGSSQEDPLRALYKKQLLQKK